MGIKRIFPGVETYWTRIVYPEYYFYGHLRDHFSEFAFGILISILRCSGLNELSGDDIPSRTPDQRWVLRNFMKLVEASELTKDNRLTLICLLLSTSPLPVQQSIFGI
jgi:hypothetical protein